MQSRLTKGHPSTRISTTTSSRGRTTRAKIRASWLAAVLLLSIGELSCAGESAIPDTALADPCRVAVEGSPPFEGASRSRGEQRFQTDCAECHSLSESREKLPGPHLSGIVNREIGGSDYYGYSPGFRGRDDRWTLWALDQYIEDPQYFVPGTRMKYAGLLDRADRMDLLAFLACEGTAR
jgi:cytochrome c